MISTSEALRFIEENVKPLGHTSCKLTRALNKVLAEDSIAQTDLPPFNQSAMDGYALKFGASKEFKVIGEIQAGDDATSVQLQNGEAIKIFTGAMCPESADTVCRIEDIEEFSDQIKVTTMPLSGANIRLQGEQIKLGEKGLKKGDPLNPAAIGFLANLGISEVQVYDSPKVSITSTGNELVPFSNGAELKPGKIYESNGIMIQNALRSVNYDSFDPVHLEDDFNVVLDGLKAQLEKSDVVIISGGISVGDYDFVGSALLKLGVEQVFYKVNQKPGKPLFFGRKGNKLVFALPGNPAAALTCFYIYVLPALNKLSGNGFKQLARVKATLGTPIKKSNTREQFLKAYCINGEVKVLEGQSSAMLRTYAKTNALLHLPANVTPGEGDEVDVILI